MLTFLKLGGSLITDKDRPHTPRPEVIARLAEEIAAARREKPDLRLVLGHGSGSFGHAAAGKHGTREGVHTPQAWRGFAEVWQAARSLNCLVTEALHAAGLPAVAFPLSAAATVEAGRVVAWNLYPLRSALASGLLPVVYGDVAFDTARGGTILSTEDIFAHLGAALHPRRILIAGAEPGVWADYPACTRIIPKLTPADLERRRTALRGSASTDVTGGMLSKVTGMLSLLEAQPALDEVCIFGGAQTGAVRAALLGASPGTLLRRA